jgi:hypothetical protein
MCRQSLPGVHGFFTFRRYGHAVGVMIRSKKYHGLREVGASRYLALYIAQLGWVVLGLYFMQKAYWPSSCSPRTLYQIYACSPRLPEERHFIETALFTWLWVTPILVLLEVSQRYRAWCDRRQR